MKILVGFKRVIDYHLTARPKADGSDVELTGVKMSPNPFDEIALEEALKLKEAGKATEVVAVSIGPEAAKETLRTALAMGADRAIHMPCDVRTDSFTIAQALKTLVDEEKPQLVLLGKQAIDTDSGQTPSMLAELLGWPQALCAYKLELEGAAAKVKCEVDGGLETFAFDLPAVISVDLRLNTPRFVSMPNIIKARSKPIEDRPIAVAASVVVQKEVFAPKQQRKNQMLETVDDLMKHLEGVL